MSLVKDVCGWVVLATGLAANQVLVARPKYSAQPTLPFVTVRVADADDDRGDEEMIWKADGVQFSGTSRADVELRAFGPGSGDLLEKMKRTRKRPDIAAYLQTKKIGPEIFGSVKDITKLDSSIYESQHIRSISLNYNFDLTDETVDIVSSTEVQVSGNLLRSDTDTDPLAYALTETVP